MKGMRHNITFIIFFIILFWETGPIFAKIKDLKKSQLIEVLNIPSGPLLVDEVGTQKKTSKLKHQKPNRKNIGKIFLDPDFLKYSHKKSQWNLKNGQIYFIPTKKLKESFLKYFKESTLQVFLKNTMKEKLKLFYLDKKALTSLKNVKFKKMVHYLKGYLSLKIIDEGTWQIKLKNNQLSHIIFLFNDTVINQYFSKASKLNFKPYFKVINNNTNKIYSFYFISVPIKSFNVPVYNVINFFMHMLKKLEENRNQTKNSFSSPIAKHWLSLLEGYSSSNTIYENINLYNQNDEIINEKKKDLRTITSKIPNFFSIGIDQFYINFNVKKNSLTFSNVKHGNPAIISNIKYESCLSKIRRNEVLIGSCEEDLYNAVTINTFNVVDTPRSWDSDEYKELATSLGVLDNEYEVILDENLMAALETKKNDANYKDYLLDLYKIIAQRAQSDDLPSYTILPSWQTEFLPEYYRFNLDNNKLKILVNPYVHCLHDLEEFFSTKCQNFRNSFQIASRSTQIVESTYHQLIKLKINYTNSIPYTTEWNLRRSLNVQAQVQQMRNGIEAQIKKFYVYLVNMGIYNKLLNHILNASQNQSSQTVASRYGLPLYNSSQNNEEAFINVHYLTINRVLGTDIEFLVHNNRNDKLLIEFILH